MAVSDIQRRYYANNVALDNNEVLYLTERLMTFQRHGKASATIISLLCLGNGKCIVLQDDVPIYVLKHAVNNARVNPLVPSMTNIPPSAVAGTADNRENNNNNSKRHFHGPVRISNLDFAVDMSTLYADGYMNVMRYVYCLENWFYVSYIQRYTLDMPAKSLRALEIVVRRTVTAKGVASTDPDAKDDDSDDDDDDADNDGDGGNGNHKEDFPFDPEDDDDHHQLGGSGDYANTDNNRVASATRKTSTVSLPTRTIYSAMRTNKHGNQINVDTLGGPSLLEKPTLGRRFVNALTFGSVPLYDDIRAVVYELVVDFPLSLISRSRKDPHNFIPISISSNHIEGEEEEEEEEEKEKAIYKGKGKEKRVVSSSSATTLLMTDHARSEQTRMSPPPPPSLASTEHRHRIPFPSSGSGSGGKLVVIRPHYVSSSTISPPSLSSSMRHQRTTTTTMITTGPEKSSEDTSSCTKLIRSLSRFESEQGYSMKRSLSNSDEDSSSSDEEEREKCNMSTSDDDLLSSEEELGSMEILNETPMMVGRVPVLPMSKLQQHSTSLSNTARQQHLITPVASTPSSNSSSRQTMAVALDLSSSRQSSIPLREITPQSNIAIAEEDAETETKERRKKDSEIIQEEATTHNIQVGKLIKALNEEISNDSSSAQSSHPKAIIERVFSRQEFM